MDTSNRMVVLNDEPVKVVEDGTVKTKAIKARKYVYVRHTVPGPRGKIDVMIEEELYLSRVSPRLTDCRVLDQNS